MSVLITGAGIIGSQIARQLVDRGERPVLLDLAPHEEHVASVVPPGTFDLVAADVRDVKALDEIVARYGVKSIIHTAALLTGPSRENPRRAVEVNIGGAMNMLELSRSGAVGRVVLCSSTTVTYPAFASYVDTKIPEDFSIRVISQRPGSFYSATKLATEFIATLYREQFGVDVAIVRYGAVLGAWGGENVGLVARMLSSLLLPAQEGRESVIDDPVFVWEGIEEFVDSRDCARGTLAVLEAATLPQPIYTLSSDKGWTMGEFISVVRDVCPSLRVRYDVRPKGGFAGFPLVRRATSDIAAAARDLDWRPQYSLRDSIEHFARVTRKR